MNARKSIGRVFGTVLTVILAVLLACNCYTIAVRYITGEKHPTVFGFSSAVVMKSSSGTSRPRS